MRMILAGVAACLCLAGCQQSASQASEETPAPPKDLGRSQTFYQGQGQILKVESATVTPGKTPDTLILTAKGEAAGPGYADLRFLRRIYPGPPPDGIYEVDVVATKPAAAAPAAATPIEIKGDWAGYPKARLKGVRFMAQSNSVTVPLAAAAPAG